MRDGPVLFLCWIDQQGRSRDLAERLGAELHLIHSGITRRLVTAPLRYLDQMVTTGRVIAGRRPSALIVMQPPLPLLVIAWIAAKWRPRPLRLVVDYHHDPFEERRWRWSLRPSIAISRRCELSIVTNPAHHAILEAAGVRSLVLHDPPADPGTRRDGMQDAGHVLVPSSYSPDEPLDAILEAAAGRAEQRFLVTGRVPPGLDVRPPVNVTLTDFVSDAEYERLLATAAAVCCLTVNDNTMQRGGYEALAWHKPLVTSDRAVLRDYFGDAAVYCRPEDAASIGTALDVALASPGTYSARMAERHAELVASYEAELLPVKEALGLF
jgi:glycosyltransferase involved in cell wall biosynthesis